MLSFIYRTPKCYVLRSQYSESKFTLDNSVSSLESVGVKAIQLGKNFELCDYGANATQLAGLLNLSPPLSQFNFPVLFFGEIVPVNNVYFAINMLLGCIQLLYPHTIK